MAEGNGDVYVDGLGPSPETELNGKDMVGDGENAGLCRTVCRPYCISWFIILGYIIFGGLLFKLVETPRGTVTSSMPQNTNSSSFSPEAPTVITYTVETMANVTRQNLVKTLREVFMKENDTEWTARAEELLLVYETSLRLQEVEARPKSDDAGLYTTESAFADWLNSCFFCLTVVTTIGYGHMFPLTPLGQVVCIFYAGFGIPIFFLYLAKLGELCAIPVKRIYLKCSGCRGRCESRTSRSKRKQSASINEHELQEFTADGDLQVTNNTQENGAPPVVYFKNVELENSESSDLIEIDLGCSVSLHSEQSSEKGKGEHEDETEPFLVRTESADAGPRTSRQNSQLSADDSDENRESQSLDAVDLDKVEVPIRILSTILLVYILMCSAVFSSMENWSFIESIYFCVITFSTIGFGDYVPGHDRPVKQLLVAGYIVLGMLVTSACISLSQKRIARFAKWFFNCRYCNKRSSGCCCCVG
ncbi:potassium channel subfamily K member 18-like [Ptychodera flava]|uniref:potassium channel subfamily K member 18-like n=1 Tax=Ptychodera flava TaxID=63121 RepID=UPI00396A48D4